MEKLREKRTHSFANGMVFGSKEENFERFDRRKKKRSDVFLRRLVFGHQKYSSVKRSNC